MKVGDRVIGVGKVDGKNIDGLEGTIKAIDKDLIRSFAIEFDKNIDGHSCEGRCKINHGWYVSEGYIKPINETIVIYRKDNEVIALDKATGKKAVAKCDPRDKFDFKVGAKLAFERLTRNVIFRFLAIESYKDYFTKGKLYECLDGYVYFDGGRSHSIYKSFDEFNKCNNCWRDKVVEIKEGDDTAKILKEYKSLKIGAMVKVVDTELTYDTYDNWDGLGVFQSHFVNHKLPVKDKSYKIVNIAPHALKSKGDIVLIQDLDTTQMFIVAKRGLKVVDETAPVVSVDEMRARLDSFCKTKTCSNCPLNDVKHCYERATPDELRANYEKVFGKGGVR